ncbi:hypothetical protein GE300_05895 [Rhodobacteraceae bacterium 2CG4]|uniref:Sulfotransferase family protein n=1 Tax=Halovulum marinum TaxID=2662447 RepID=A0A6L5YZJ4_9RHOB|nr:hypothetical protein [Halovulum marinum]MSU89154.1 hypothetical protein [Halovulum marinum]
MATDAPPAVAVHLGAQKTGSTWLYQVMAANAAAHGAAGVRLLDRDRVRARITRPLLDRRTHRAGRALAALRARRWLAAEARGAGRLVISDENMIGGITEVLRNGALYPSAGRRMTTLAALLGDRPVELFLGIRAQDRFSSSLMAEAVRIGAAKRQTPDSVAARWWECRPRWTALVAALLRAAPQASLTVWDFDALTGAPAGAVNRLVGLPPGTRVVVRAKFRREGLSARAIDEILRVRAAQGPPAARAAEPDIRARYPRGEAWPAFSLWDAGRAAALQADYVADLEALARMPRVRLVSARELA